MEPLKQTVSRRTALRLVGGGIAGLVALATGALTAVLTARSPAAPVQVDLAGVAATAGEPTTVVPAGGAGLFDVDPDQGVVSQDPAVAARGDLASLPEDMEV